MSLDMMQYLFYILCILSVVHFLYQQVILISIKLHYRNRLLLLRDKIKEEIIATGTGEDEQALRIMYNGLNNVMHRLDYLTFRNKVESSKKIKKDKSLDAAMQEEITILNSCNNSTLHDVLQRLNHILNAMLFFNTLMMFLYFFPLFLLIKLSSIITNTFPHTLKKANKYFTHSVQNSDLKKAMLLLPENHIRVLLSLYNY